MDSPLTTVGLPVALAVIMLGSVSGSPSTAVNSVLAAVDGILMFFTATAFGYLVSRERQA